MPQANNSRAAFCRVIAELMVGRRTAQQLAQGWTQALKGMTGVQIPADALPALQSTYLSEAAALWNQATQGADGTPPPQGVQQAFHLGHGILSGFGAVP